MSEENVEIVRRIYDAIRWMRGGGVLALSEADAKAALKVFFDSEVEVQQLAGLEGITGTYHGYDGLLKATAELAEGFSEWWFVPEQHFAQGDTVVFDVRAFATGRSSGVQSEIRIAQLWKLREGRVVRWVVYPSLEQAFEAAGLSE